jgi:Formamidopyrimidine-DNA glycosylase
MPELPDVENDRRLLDRLARRKIIRAVEVRDDRVLRKLSPAEFKRRAVGRRIVSSRRMASISWSRSTRAAGSPCISG